MSPEDAKLHLKLRPLINGAGVLVVFGFVAIVFAQFSWRWIPDFLAIGVLYYLYFFVLDKRAIGMRCPHCRKYIATNTPWVCGFCKQPNRNANEHPFIGKCGHCHDEAKAYKCHHCGEFIFLSADEDKAGYAYALNSTAETPAADSRAEKVKSFQAVKEDKQFEIEIAELDEKLKRIKERLEGPKVKAPYEQKVEMFEKDFAGMMGIREYARKKRAEVAESYKNHPEFLKEANEAIDEILRRHA